MRNPPNTLPITLTPPPRVKVKTGMEPANSRMYAHGSHTIVYKRKVSRQGSQAVVPGWTVRQCLAKGKDVDKLLPAAGPLFMLVHGA